MSTPSTRLLRRLPAGAVALGLAIAVAGCSGGAGSAGSAEYEPAPSDLTASIDYGIWDQTQVAAIDESIAGFNELYPNIDVSVNVTPFSDYWTKLQTQGSSGSLPDVFWMNGPNIGLYASNDLLAPITGAVDAGDIDPSMYPESLVDLYTVDDVAYGVPKDFDTIAIWANRAIFEQAGVEVPTGDWTWDEFQQAAAQISTSLAAQGIYGGAGGMDGQTTYYDTIMHAGGEVIADGESGYDSPEAQAGIQFWTDLIASGASPSMQQLTDTPADQWFTSGRLGMYWGGSWFRAALTDLDFADQIVALPLPQGEQAATVIHGVSNVVSANSDDQQAAQAFQAYMAGEEAQQTQGAAGSIIPAYDGTQQAFVDSMPSANLQVFIDAVDDSQPLPVSRGTATWNALETELLPSAFSGEVPVADVTADLAEQMDAALAEE